MRLRDFPDGNKLAESDPDFRFTAVVAPPPDRGLFAEFDNACKLLTDIEQTRAVIHESEVEKVVDEIAGDLRV